MGRARCQSPGSAGLRRWQEPAAPPAGGSRARGRCSRGGRRGQGGRVRGGGSVPPESFSGRLGPEESGTGSTASVGGPAASRVFMVLWEWRGSPLPGHPLLLLGDGPLGGLSTHLTGARRPAGSVRVWGCCSVACRPRVLGTLLSRRSGRAPCELGSPGRASLGTGPPLEPALQVRVWLLDTQVVFFCFLFLAHPCPEQLLRDETHVPRRGSGQVAVRPFRNTGGFSRGGLARIPRPSRPSSRDRGSCSVACAGRPPGRSLELPGEGLLGRCL